MHTRVRRDEGVPLIYGHEQSERESRVSSCHSALPSTNVNFFDHNLNKILKYDN